MRKKSGLMDVIDDEFMEWWRMIVLDACKPQPEKKKIYQKIVTKSKVLVVGGTGYIGKTIVKASLAQGHITYVLQRPEIGLDIDKLQILLSFKKKGARLVKASFSDHKSLVNAVNQVDVVICTMSGVHFRSHNITMQLKLVDAIKEAGNIKRFLPSEFGMDPARMVNALEPGRTEYAYTVMAMLKWFMDEEDIATYTIKSIDDPRTLNKTLYIRPKENILSQMQLIDKWERLSGNKLKKLNISAEDFLDSMKGMDYASQVGNGSEEASELYPEVEYIRMESYLKHFL
ncbi:NmrA domain-containing protein [Heracleum sosnowskyi]|uniref:NmrA domain-containing protein n=1 Tax=Heracleum sosnowskyi TaxID=360622 RepID=A0AAD8HX14_9APIA|nr:NmrA domain-containing protein [Heracleum sosnowskyi]